MQNGMLMLPVMEHFYTIQGEGRWQGSAAYFIRLGGCDVGCVWCDVKDSWDATQHPVMSVEELVNQVTAAGAEIAVITGGEPLLHDLHQLTQALKSAGVRTHIESSGSSPLSGQWDWICVSPKKFKAPLEEVVVEADEIKVVIFNKTDFDWAEQWEEKAKPGCLLYLQPEWEKREKVMPLMVEYVKSNPRWKMCLQTHKYMHIP